TDSGDRIYLGTDFPDEFAGSKYTRKSKGARAKAKANVAQGVRELIEIATNKTFRENHKEKHSTDARNGWYYYTMRFALPIYDNEKKTNQYNVYTGCLVVNCALGGKMYLYDLVDIKKEASNPLKTI
ncbi:MAG: XRE family transcriptional regulator, partial [Lachnospiraceae bacterium]|nr:XRE family transcriptional regulator [Lachnospiraceae bacterium]